MSNERLYNELEELCNYDYEEMQRTLNALQNMLDLSINNDEDEENNKRYCSICKKEMTEGYYNEDEFQYYCSDECLHKDYTDEEYNKLYDEGRGNFYWTSWEED